MTQSGFLMEAITRDIASLARTPLGHLPVFAIGFWQRTAPVSRHYRIAPSNRRRDPRRGACEFVRGRSLSFARTPCRRVIVTDRAAVKALGQPMHDEEQPRHTRQVEDPAEGVASRVNRKWSCAGPATPPRARSSGGAAPLSVVGHAVSDRPRASCFLARALGLRRYSAVVAAIDVAVAHRCAMQDGSALG